MHYFLDLCAKKTTPFHVWGTSEVCDDYYCCWGKTLLLNVVILDFTADVFVEHVHVLSSQNSMKCDTKIIYGVTLFKVKRPSRPKFH